MGAQARVLKGVPAGGQFATTGRAEPGVRLVVVNEDTYPVNDAFPIPQANDLEKVACVVDAVSAGADTPEAVGTTLAVHHREGAYYADAAGYLGLVDTVSGEAYRRYELTELGKELLEHDAAGRADLIRRVVACAPVVQAIADDDQRGVDLIMGAAGLGDVTADRRKATARSWLAALGSDADLGARIQVTGMDASSRVQAAAEQAAEARRRVREAARERPVPVCSSCNQALPATGRCDWCD